MRQVVYRVATSVDGYIAGLGGAVDWIVPEPSLDFSAVYSAVDTVLLGRRTYELTLRPGSPPWPEGWHVYVFSRTLMPEQRSTVTVVSKDAGATVAALRTRPGKQIWLFGGGSLFRSLLEAKQVDVVEIVVSPVMLGGGVPLLGTGAPLTRLALVDSQSYPSGVVALRYGVRYTAA